MASMTPVREWRNVDRAMFRNEIMPANEPAILKGVAAHWPMVQAGLSSDEALAQHINGFDRGVTINPLVAPPAIAGQFGYTENLDGFNFERRTAPVSTVVNRLLDIRSDPNPPTIAVQSAAIPEHLPGLLGPSDMPLVDASVSPRIWIGNAVTVATHFDFSYNIACVAGGRRRFTLFPPDQMKNLYIGPLDFTPAGAPVSLVSLDEPDLDRYPLFAEALKTAQVAELEPGDGIYIPFYWWHHVKSLSAFNVLVNYWWAESEGEPYEAMVHALTVMRGLTPAERETWRAAFDYYVFQTSGDPAAHIPAHRRGVLGGLTGNALRGLKEHLMASIGRLS